MSKINLHNYEATYLDYIEGNLNAEDTAELLLFLENHGELKIDLEDFEMVNLNSNEEIQFDHKHLKKEISAANAEGFIIESLENQLTEEDEDELSLLISKNANLQKLAYRYSKTILPVVPVEFPGKSQLKKKAGVLVFMTPLMRVAAIGLLLIILIPFFNKEAKVELAETHSPSTVAPIDTAIKSIESKTTTQTKIKEATKEAPIESVLMAEDLSRTTISASQKVKIIEVPIAKPQNEVFNDSNLKSITPKEVKTKIIQEENEAIAVIPAEKISPIEEKELIALTETEPQTIGAWLNEKIRKRVFKQDRPSDDKIAGNELLAGASSLLQQKTNANIAFTHNSSAVNTSYTFTVGKFSFSKTKNN